MSRIPESPRLLAILSDIDDQFRSEAMTITLSDGTSDTFIPTSTATFRGYVSTGPFITSLVMGVSAASRFNNVDNLLFGKPVPEPSASGLLLGALGLGLLSRRHRRPQSGSVGSR